MWRTKILTLNPEAFPGPLAHSVIGRGLSKWWNLEVKNIRDYSKLKHKKADDTIYGGGNGMLIRADVLGDAIDDFFETDNPNKPILYASPRGIKFDQKMALDFSQKQGIQLISGKFEGIDERVLQYYNIKEVSIGDYILSSGDIPILVIINACVRLLSDTFITKGDNLNPLNEESFSLFDQELGALLEYPQYTKPRIWRDLEVPKIFLSGHHKNIQDIRKIEAKRKTLLMKKKFNNNKDV
ncbi:tRNA (guanine-N(1)-)-methyltransferase [Candidatus Fokinia solitaria]|uniref:tRNA (guanine-N(1)-)-methyltransferase n=1 Tax=Candidatus Fokinia solitaria TaxID=1802984 RepID=A0A2U8BS83_9RICK|nr:tRNA (guanosine(37)-N1)-methyltransferase TrmD [Candidatus Fokinia solitaria]AWD33214.1 tRNA (guanine-N(1)-)-methyltransferase [Candidatus Fokinia solitaria]